MSGNTAIIIGSGVGGLATAIRLAVQGWQVHVYEQNNYSGGKIGRLHQDGYTFDTGPSLFVQPQNIEALFELAEESIASYFSYRKLPASCTYFYENGKTVTAPADVKALAMEMETQLGEPAEHVCRYLQAAEKLYHSIGTAFLDNSLHKYDFIYKSKIFKAFAAARYKYLFYSLHKYNSGIFRTKETIQLFDRFATYSGSDPYRAPGMLSMIAHTEMNEGVFYPDGGMISIVNALYQLAAKKGVHFHFNTTVQRIIHHEGKVRGIVAGNENHLADIVISNADIYFTYKHLLGNEDRAKRIIQQERSSSAYIFYWGINGQFDKLGLHNIFFSSDYKKEFKYLFRTKEIYNDPTIYVNITSKMEAEHAPDGKENWFVMVNAPADGVQSKEALQLQMREYIIDKLNRMLQTDIAKLIETEAVFNPYMIESTTGAFMGSLYGSSSNTAKSAFLRHPNFSSEVKGLYFVGGTVHPGGGIPLCLKSASIVADLVRKAYRHNRKAHAL